MLKKNIRKRLLKDRLLKYKKTKFNLSKIIFIIKKKEIKNPLIGGYYPVNCEIDCMDILNFLENKNYNISLPVIGQNNRMEFYKYSFKDQLYLNKYGIPEPKKTKIVYPDFLFVPLVGFDHRLYRLGYGGGYYDRYLTKLGKIKTFTSVGLAFPFQKISRVPNEPFDKKLDMIITSSKTYL